MAHSIYKYHRGLGRYFVYGHFREDTCSVFYIGIGTKQGSSSGAYYQRAFAKARRNPHWKNITNLSSYRVVILFESDNLEEVKQKEIALIVKYKERLCNISLGGDCPSEEFLTRKRVYQYTLSGDYLTDYQSIADAARFTKLSTSTLYNSIAKNKINNAGGFQWFYEYRGETVPSILTGRSTKKGVRLYNGTEEHIFNSREECALFISRSPGRVTDLIKQGYFQNYNIENYG